MPGTILLFSGKRKCGKDYLTDKLAETLGINECVIIKISAPIKSHFAKMNNLNFSDLMSDGPYKEIYRKEMIEWSEEERRKDPGVFCNIAIQQCEGKDKPIWIISDIRRKTDISWFKLNFGNIVKTIRLEADEDVRKKRGWIFENGVDDVTSECDLDDCEDWNLKINNNGDVEVKCILQNILTQLNTTR